jgi:neopullulanase
MRVVLDGVFNHTGRGFWPFHHILEAGAASPYRDWFHLDPDVLAGHRLLTPYPPLDAPTGFSLGYKAWWGLPALPKINTDHPDAREYLLSVAEHWLRFGIDGWRLDVPQEIKDPAFWAEFRRRCRAVRPDAYLVGEIWEVAPEWVGDHGFDALMDYPLGEAILGYVGGPSLDFGVVNAHHEYRKHLRPLDGRGFADRLAKLLGVYDPDVVAVQLNLIGSHDAPRALTVLGGDVAALRMATLLQCTLPGAPSIYYGDEIGLTGGNDPANRGSFPWDEAGWDRDLRAFTRSLLRLRAAEPALRHGSTATIAADGPGLAFERRLDERRLVVAVNPGTDPIVLDAALEGVGAGRLDVVDVDGSAGSDTGPVDVRDGTARIAVSPRTGLVLRLAG